MGTDHGNQRKGRGLLVAFEGIDASGKNTQSKMLFNWLKAKKYSAELVSFPDYSTVIGQEIRAFLTGKRAYSNEAKHVLYAANRYEHKEQIEKWLRVERKIVLVNRYSDSNVAYGVANGLSWQWLKAIESQMPQPDYVFLLKATPELSKDREKAERDIYEIDSSFLSRVSEVYDVLAEKGKWFVVDANRPVETIHYETLRLTEELILSSLN